MKTATELVRLVVKNVAAVDKPANRRTWLLLKAESGDPLVKAGIKSENDRRRAVDAAVRAKWGSTTDWQKAYLDDIWDGDEAIVCKDGETYSTPFTIKDGVVEFGDLTPVTRAWVAKRQREMSAEVLQKAESVAAFDAMTPSDKLTCYYALADAGAVTL